MQSKLDRLQEKYRELEREIADPTLVKNQKRYQKVMREYAHLKEIMEAAEKVTRTREELAEVRSLAEREKDPDLGSLAFEEVEKLGRLVQEREQLLKELLLPKDPLDHKNTIMEIRAGTGGDEAALFASDLFRMYSRYAEKKGWSLEIISSSDQEQGGFKEVIFSMKGKNVYAEMRHESGTHRVQRIPLTEASGRVHTSAVTVAVLPEAEATDIEIRNEDLKIDVYRSSGPGGQSVNTTDSAVRITHLPTKTVVTQQDEKSQIKNRSKALRILRSRLYEQEERKKRIERTEERRSQVGTGDRSGRIRTYNFPQNRLTDHRIGLTLYTLDTLIEGEIEALIVALRSHSQEEILKGDVA